MGVLAVNGDELILPSGLTARLPFTTIFHDESAPTTNVLIQQQLEKLQPCIQIIDLCQFIIKMAYDASKEVT